jgi:hypothetical protein
METCSGIQGKATSYLAMEACCGFMMAAVGTRSMRVILQEYVLVPRDCNMATQRN